MKIKQIFIQNYFGRGNVNWMLNGNVNILGGKNGGGKSTMFKACYALLKDSNCKDVLDALLMPIAEELTVTMCDGTVVTWVAPKEQCKFGDTFPITLAGGIVRVVDADGKEMALDVFQKNVTVQMIDSFEQHLGKALQYDQEPKSTTLDDPTMLDLMIRDQINLRNSLLSEMMERYADDEDGEARDTYMHRYRLIYEVLMRFLEGYDGQPKSKFLFTKGGTTFGYERLSMGEKQMLLLLLMVSNTNGEECVFFMDEPDLSMHIDWKEKLVTALHDMNPQMQIILSTHAPSVITGWIDCVKEMSELIEKR